MASKLKNDLSMQGARMLRKTDDRPHCKNRVEIGGNACALKINKH